VTPSAWSVAAVQMHSTADVQENLAVAERLIGQAAARGAQIIVLPERWNAIGSAELYPVVAEPLTASTSVRAVRRLATFHGVSIVAGSITERGAEPGRVFNTSVVIDRSGQVIASYRKLHLFDVAVGGFRYSESDTDDAGEAIVDVDVDGLAVGLSICYDLRFPELYRLLALRGVDVVTVPADFTLHTGKDHWELLLRARAVENGVYVIAAAQHGNRPDGRTAYGRSMIVDPWGTVLAQAPDGEGHIVAELDLDRLAEIRAQLPALANRRAEVYHWPEEVRA
jgi:deaminated glutathione amidase